MTSNEYINHAGIVQSCCIPHDMHIEHRVPAHCILFVRSGMLIVRGKERTDEITAGNYAFVRRDCSVDILKTPLNGEPYRGVNFTLQRADLKEYYNRVTPTCARLRSTPPLDRVVAVLPQTLSLQSLFVSLLPFTDAGETPTNEWLKLKVQEAIMSLLSIDEHFYPTLFDFNEAWKVDILDFMEQNFTEDLTLEEFASYTGRSLATFKRDFAKISPLSPQRWIIEHRLERAKELLANQNIPIQDVGFMVGFKNRSHFSQAFKKHFGYAPNQLIKK